MNSPTYMSLYPTMDSMLEVVKYAEAQCPIQSPNDLFPILMVYHNTLLKELGNAPSFDVIAAQLHVTGLNLQEEISKQYAQIMNNILQENLNA